MRSQPNCFCFEVVFVIVAVVDIVVVVLIFVVVLIVFVAAHIGCSFGQ